MNIRVGLGFIVIILTGCRKTYDCTCTTDVGLSVNVGTVTGSKKKAKGLCEKSLNSISTYTSCTINE